MPNSIKITQFVEDINLAEDGEEEDDFWPEGVPRNYAWNQSDMDWIGQKCVAGLEGSMSITVSYYGCTKEQRELINSVMCDFGSEARELFQRLLDKKTKSLVAAETGKN
jgi:hypothetical protein